MTWTEIESVCREAEGKVTEETNFLCGLPDQCSVSKALREEECKELKKTCYFN